MYGKLVIKIITYVYYVDNRVKKKKNQNNFF